MARTRKANINAERLATMERDLINAKGFRIQT